MNFDRRNMLEALATLGTIGMSHPLSAAAGKVTGKRIKGSYRPGRIQNEYSLFLPGEREALRTPPH